MKIRQAVRAMSARLSIDHEFVSFDSLERLGNGAEVAAPVPAAAAP